MYLLIVYFCKQFDQALNNLISKPLSEYLEDGQKFKKMAQQVD